MAVRLGHPIETLTSLEVLLDPALVEEVLNAYWNASETEEEPCVYTIDLAWKLLSVARRKPALPLRGRSCEAGLTGGDLNVIRAVLTEKNLNVIRAVLMISVPC